MVGLDSGRGYCVGGNSEYSMTPPEVPWLLVVIGRLLVVH